MKRAAYLKWLSRKWRPSRFGLGKNLQKKHVIKLRIVDFSKLFLTEGFPGSASLFRLIWFSCRNMGLTIQKHASELTRVLKIVNSRNTFLDRVLKSIKICVRYSMYSL